MQLLFQHLQLSMLQKCNESLWVPTSWISKCTHLLSVLFIVYLFICSLTCCGDKRNKAFAEVSPPIVVLHQQQGAEKWSKPLQSERSGTVRYISAILWMLSTLWVWRKSNLFPILWWTAWVFGDAEILAVCCLLTAFVVGRVCCKWGRCLRLLFRGHKKIRFELLWWDLWA